MMIIIITLSVFIIMKNAIGNIGGMPQSFKDAYGESVFVKNGIIYPTITLLMTVIMVHLLWNYCYLQKDMSLNSKLKGTFYGFAFGGLWFLSFLESFFIYHSNLLKHMASGLRDLVSLTVFGVITGLFFTTKTDSPIKRRESLLVIIPTSVLFAFFHGVQYYLTSKPLEQKIDSLSDVIWLLALGLWIGIMYYFFSPKMKNIVYKTLFFAFNTFGINWFLYNAFYLFFLDMPVFDTVIRCLFGTIGVFLGLLVYELARKRSRVLKKGASESF